LISLWRIAPEEDGVQLESAVSLARLISMPHLSLCFGCAALGRSAKAVESSDRAADEGSSDVVAPGFCFSR